MEQQTLMTQEEVDLEIAVKLYARYRVDVNMGSEDRAMTRLIAGIQTALKDARESEERK